MKGWLTLHAIGVLGTPEDRFFSEGISAQGTLVSVQRLGSGAFVDIGELRDITPPAKSRNPIELTNHNDTDDSYIVGIRRSSEMTINVNYLPDSVSHQLLEEMLDEGTRDIWRVAFPDGPAPGVGIGDGTKWLFSGYVTNIQPAAPVDDRLSADITIRPTGTRMTIAAEPAMARTNGGAAARPAAAR